VNIGRDCIANTVRRDEKELGKKNYWYWYLKLNIGHGVKLM
jgi:hypothetical protein